MAGEEFLATDILPYVGYAFAGVIGAWLLKNGLKTIRPTHLGAIETWGKYTGFRRSGLTFVIPFIQQLRTVNVTEQLVDVEKQDVITKENLNCMVDAQVYYKIIRDEESMKKAMYEVNNVDRQMVELAQSTLRAVIGQKMFKEVNAQRQTLNKLIYDELKEQTNNWGVQIVRVELKEIFPPKDVQQTMNEIIKAENEKDKQADLAKAKIIATEGNAKAMVIDAEGKKKKQIIDSEAIKEKQKIEAEGEKEMIRLQAEAQKTKLILEAEGTKAQYELEASGQAKAIRDLAEATADKYELENSALTEFFTESAITHKNLDTIENAYAENSKIIVTDKDTPLTFIMDEVSDKRRIIPTKDENKSDKKKYKDIRDKWEKKRKEIEEEQQRREKEFLKNLPYGKGENRVVS